LASRDILTDLGFIADGDYDSLLETYRQKCKEKVTVAAHVTVTGPCCYYNYKGCMLDELHCRFTHICKDWFTSSFPGKIELWLSRYLVMIRIAFLGIFPGNWQE
jgi:hypothetical protein